MTSGQTFSSEQVRVFGEEVLKLLVEADADVGVEFRIDLDGVDLQAHGRRAGGGSHGEEAEEGDGSARLVPGHDRRLSAFDPRQSNANEGERVLNGEAGDITAELPGRRCPGPPRRCGRGSGP